MLSKRCKRAGKAALRNGFAPTYSEIWLDYAGQRQLRFRFGTDCPASLLTQAKTLFDAEANWALRPEKLSQLERLLQAAQDAGHELRCYDDAWQFVAQIRDGERRQALEQWLRQIPDEPGELLRRKFWYEQQQRQEQNQ